MTQKILADSSHDPKEYGVFSANYHKSFQFKIILLLKIIVNNLLEIYIILKKVR
ncbi:MAG: hypothetical protein LBT10_00770 [Methanobrevibacter sp.]|nr:hypothetical protein [Methanobrevibacter sp.]